MIWNYQLHKSIYGLALLELCDLIEQKTIILYLQGGLINSQYKLFQE